MDPLQFTELPPKSFDLAGVGEPLLMVGYVVTHHEPLMVGLMVLGTRVMGIVALLMVM